MPSKMNTDEQPAPPRPPIHGLAWPGQRDEVSGAGHLDRQPIPRRNEPSNPNPHAWPII